LTRAQDGRHRSPRACAARPFARQVVPPAILAEDCRVGGRSDFFFPRLPIPRVAPAARDTASSGDSGIGDHDDGNDHACTQRQRESGERVSPVPLRDRGTNREAHTRA